MSSQQQYAPSFLATSSFCTGFPLSSTNTTFDGNASRLSPATGTNASPFTIMLPLTGAAPAFTASPANTRLTPSFVSTALPPQNLRIALLAHPYSFPARSAAFFASSGIPQIITVSPAGFCTTAAPTTLCSTGPFFTCFVGPLPGSVSGISTSNVPRAASICLAAALATSARMRSIGVLPVAITVRDFEWGSVPMAVKLSGMPRATITLRGWGVMGSRRGMRCWY